MPAPLLSVIVPVYNEARTVGELLRRVASGPYPHPEQEVIVVDDGSSEGDGGDPPTVRRAAGVRVLSPPDQPGQRGGRPNRVVDLAWAGDDRARCRPRVGPARLPGCHRADLQREAVAVYGSRHMAPNRVVVWTRFRAAVAILNELVWLCTASG